MFIFQVFISEDPMDNTIGGRCDIGMSDGNTRAWGDTYIRKDAHYRQLCLPKLNGCGGHCLVDSGAGRHRKPSDIVPVQASLVRSVNKAG